VIEAGDGATAREIMTQLGIPQDYPNILLVNGKQAHSDTVVKTARRWRFPAARRRTGTLSVGTMLARIVRERSSRTMRAK